MNRLKTKISTSDPVLEGPGLGAPHHPNLSPKKAHFVLVTSVTRELSNMKSLERQGGRVGHPPVGKLLD